MSKFSGTLAIVNEFADDTGIWQREVQKYPIAGDFYQDNTARLTGEKINEDLSFSMRFSFLASPNLMTILSEDSQAITPLYIEYLGLKLKVNSMTFQWPRLILTVSGVWTGD